LGGLLLPFAKGTSALRILTDALRLTDGDWLTRGPWPLALPTLLPLVLAGAVARSRARGSLGSRGALGRAERWTVTSLAAGSLALGSWFVVDHRSIFLHEGLPALLTVVAVIALGLLGVIRAARATRAGRPAGGGALVALVTAYVANAALALVSYLGSWQAGAWCVVATCALLVGLAVHLARSTGASTTPSRGSSRRAGPGLSP
jgi:hypothetical protein